MTNFLETIHARKVAEVAAIASNYPIQKGEMDQRFRKALEKRGIIAEIKRRSPSKGDLSPIPNPEILAGEYERCGAIAISCLTDADFGGTIEDLKIVTSHVDIPVLRKDFIIDPVQIAEAKTCGAAAILLIVKLVGKNLSKLLEVSKEVGVEALVEVHTEDELAEALAAGADIIGINNRDLTTFKVDPETAFRLFQRIPPHIHIVIESGISDPKTAHFYFDHAVSGCLIGEHLVKSKKRGAFFTALSAPYVKICGVRSEEVARETGRLGADFIGIICDTNSPRYVAPEAVATVAKGAKEGGATPVCVFTHHSFEEMQTICIHAGVHIVQLHGEEARKNHRRLPDTFIRFFVQPVESDGSYTPLVFEGFNPKRDYILYDCTRAGSGTSFDWNHFHPIEGIPFFLAGGLNPANVKTAKKMGFSNGFDVSSGVEKTRGNKDMILVEEFIKQVKQV